MDKEYQYTISGGNPINGKIRCFGAKNFATKAIIATLLGNSPSILTNVPPIGDVEMTIEMLKSLGATIEFDQKKLTLTIDPRTVSSASLDKSKKTSNRMPILLLGSLLHRFKEVKVPFVGGCNIGTRGVDYHLEALQKFGATIETSEKYYVAKSTEGLKGTRVDLPYPSVGATENSLFMAVLSTGQTVITNAAIEPEIMELITMLQAMGALIQIQPNRKILIEGVKELTGTQMHILGDRIEAASWAGLACASNGKITVQGIAPSTLSNYLTLFQKAGGGVIFDGPDSITFYRKKALSPVFVETDVYPGFSTDWQQPFAILLTQAEGVSIIHETVFESRFGYLEALNAMGAKTKVVEYCLGATPCRFTNEGHPHSAIITGATTLKSDNLSIEIPDLRAGLAYVIAGAIAQGTTHIKGVPLIERGYGDIITKLDGTGFDIVKVAV
jgi:UDP-N-acetylglucosamine 1-carboxyvinyltransferase